MLCTDFAVCQTQMCVPRATLRHELTTFDTTCVCVCVILPQRFQWDVRQLWELKSLSVTLSSVPLFLSISPTEQSRKTNMRITTKITNKTHAVLHINCERIVFWLMIFDCLHLCCCFLVRALATLKWWITYWARAVASNTRSINSPNQLCSF